MEVIKSIRDLMDEAKVAESEERFSDAAVIYKKVIEADEVNQPAYDRLFMMLRKNKDYKEEAKMLKHGIKAFEKLNNEGRSKSKKILELSKMLQKATGLIDKKGNAFYKPEPIPKWERRLEMVEKRISASFRNKTKRK
jgi:hypothetical protein